MVLNHQGRVFMGRRRERRGGTDGYDWQMPQGGIDRGEPPLDAALRELVEETSIRSVSVLAESPQWYSYDLPGALAAGSWKGRYIGQRQKWFALRFEGDESEINVLAPDGGHRAEFDAWRWEDMANLPALVVPFKRDVYQRVIEDFAHLLAP
jgi:putative (di)nucleoside polyphosphate hydrolase